MYTNFLRFNHFYDKRIAAIFVYGVPGHCRRK